MNTQKAVWESAMHHCDLLISQDIQADNVYGYSLSLEYIRKQVPEACKVVVLPNLVGFGKMLLFTDLAVYPWIWRNTSKNMFIGNMSYCKLKKCTEVME